MCEGVTYVNIPEQTQAHVYLQIVCGSELSSFFFDFAMQVSLVVNVASECGFTDQNYRALQQLQRDLGPHHFNVLAFPCNQFGQQEPDTNREIENFARRTYSVSFPMFSKIAVTGTGAHPAFKYLTRESCPFSPSPSLPGQQKLVAGWVTFLFLILGGKQRKPYYHLTLALP